NSQALPRAMWNQEEYDQASHKLDQERTSALTIHLQDAGTPLPDHDFRISTDYRQSVNIWRDQRQLKTSGKGSWSNDTFDYGHSHISVETQLPGKGETLQTTAGLRWIRPGQWSESVTLTVDIQDCRIARPGVGLDGHVLIEIPVIDGQTPSIHVSFRRYLGVSAAVGQTGELVSASEPSDGHISVDIDLGQFVREHIDRFEPPLAAGQTFDLGLSWAVSD